MSGDDALHEAVEHFAYYWARLDDVTKGYFERLYEAWPEGTSQILAGVQLPREGDRQTLAAWVQTNTTPVEGMRMVQPSSVQVLVHEPGGNGGARPLIQAGPKFEVAWEGYLASPMPKRVDLYEIYAASGEKVYEQRTEVPEQPSGQATGKSGPFESLAAGGYTAAITFNVDGGDGTVMTRQGVRSQISVPFELGQGSELEDKPRWTEAINYLNAAAASYRTDLAFTAAARRDENADLPTPGMVRLTPIVVENLVQAADAFHDLVTPIAPNPDDQMNSRFKRNMQVAAGLLRELRPDFELPQDRMDSFWGAITGACARADYSGRAKSEPAITYEDQLKGLFPGQLN